MRVISRFETCGKKMVTVVIGKNGFCYDRKRL